MKKTIKRNKLTLKTKIRYLFLGKRPLERKILPKIQEYLYLCFNSIFILCFIIYLASILIQKKFDFSIEKTNELLKEIQENVILRALIALFVAIYLINLIILSHITYILSKTEFNKWIGILAIIFALSVILCPLAIVFSYVAYEKNEISFE